MKLFKRIVKWAIPAVVVLLAIAITVTIGWRPVFGAKSRAVSQRVFERTPQRLERGRYLVTAVTACFECHSKMDVSREVPVTDAPGAGGPMINEGGLVVPAPNITPDRETGIGSWTDDEIARAIREGVDRNGRALFGVMPFENYRSMSNEDIASIVVYLRSVPAIHNTVPERKLPFPLSRLVNISPEPIADPVQADLTTQVKRGQYLVTMADCAGCHTARDGMGRPLPGMDLAGGNEMAPGVFSSNLTPDPSGISYYDQDLFIRAIRTGHVGARELKKPMPWWAYRNMTDEDLKAVFAYLQTIKPVHHRVDNMEVASLCKVCKRKHGLGELN